MKAFDRGQCAAALKQARMECRPAELTKPELPGTIAEAYGVSRSQVEEAAAWKIGGANPWSRKVFQNKEVFVGPLHPREVFMDVGRLPLAGLVSPLAEPEIMLEIGEWESADPAVCFRRMGLGFEIPAAVLPEALRPELTGQIADRAGAGALWITAIHPFNYSRLEREVKVQMALNGGAPTAGTSANVIGGPLGAAHEFFSLAKRYSLPVQRGQWIATGGLCPAVPVKAGDRLTLVAWGKELMLYFDG